MKSKNKRFARFYNMKGDLMKEKLIRFMHGRYGVDELSQFLMVIALLGVLVSRIARIALLAPLSWIIILIVYMRILSKNFTRCYQQNKKYLTIRNKVKNFFVIRKNKIRHKVNRWMGYHVFKCPSCKQKIKVPRGKGKVEIRCQKCNTKFIKRT